MAQKESPSQTEQYQKNGQTEKSRNRDVPLWLYRIRFRPEGREFTAESRVKDLDSGVLVMVRTDHGLEPAVVVERGAGLQRAKEQPHTSYTIMRLATREEEEKYARLTVMEEEAETICLHHIRELSLPMNLVRVERFFNGSKIIFYFTAENRVDFRELVKRLVQEFRTRVEMRQIGVRHETQMTGGLGACGRELCCTSFLNKFESVSIKMAKAQDLPLNPAKISGLCNRLLCCLTYEYDGYHEIKKEMPKVGRTILLAGKPHRVVRHLPLQAAILVANEQGEERLISEEEWRSAELVPRAKPKAKAKSKSKGRKRSRKAKKTKKVDKGTAARQQEQDKP